jgi:hypothetical protein
MEIDLWPGNLVIARFTTRRSHFRMERSLHAPPERKSLPKRIKEDGLHIDADFVCKEYQSAPGEFGRWPDEQRVRFSDVLANRINMRRAIRDIVMPMLAYIQLSLEKLNNRLNDIEQSLNKSSTD